MIPILFPADNDAEALAAANNNLLYDANGEPLMAINASIARTFTSFGLGFLTDCIRCEVTEERNGEFELELEYPMNGVLFEEIQARRIILAQANSTDSPQPFRIYSISAPISGAITVNAQHLTYDLSGDPVGEFTAISPANACLLLETNEMLNLPFILTADFVKLATFAVTEPSSVRSWFGGREGSLIDVYGGEWHFDKYRCELMQNRGTDRGVIIRYGKNLLDIKQETNIADVWTGVLAFWKDAETGRTVKSPIVNAAGDFDFRRVQVIDLSSDFEEAPTVQQLEEAARSYITANGIGKPKVSISLDYLQIDGERVELCDTVTVIFEKLGINAKAKCIKTVWDTLKERYSSIEIGDVINTIPATIEGLQTGEKRNMAKTTSMVQTQAARIDELTARVDALEGVN